ncbi:MAG: hypothetical protein PHG71_04965 [Kiritimatiellae bacterium]|nr:hypothetical protein [Kiritimatiellia bacterium]MDD4622569.1 hypothetical protein [Kiritimatiellia bacterium]
MSYLILFFNILTLFFWVRLWSAPAREFYFNPFLSGTVKLTDSVLSFLRPVLYMPAQAAAFCVMLFLVVFKTVALYRLNVGWGITVGTYFNFSPPATANPAVAILFFSFMQTAMFIIRLWTVYLLVRLITPAFRKSRALEALGFFCRPFSWTPFALQPLALLALHGAIALILTRTGGLGITPHPLGEPRAAAVSPFLQGSIALQLLKTGWLAALSVADGLMLLTRCLFALILGNLLSAITRAQGLSLICGEGVEMLLGRFARRGAAGMGFDFTPLIFFFVVDLLYNSICQALLRLIHSPMFN